MASVSAKQLARGTLLCTIFLASACANSDVKNDLDTNASEPTSLPAVETGRWHPVPDHAPQFGPEQQAALARLEALPYLRAVQIAPVFNGVVKLEANQVQRGLNLFNSGHRPEAYLMDLQGKVLHRWTYPIGNIWPNERGPHQSSYWRRVTWLPDGSALAIFEGLGLILIDRYSRLQWAYKAPVHHHAVVDSDGSVLTLIRKSVVLRRLNPDSPVLEDYLVRLTPGGDVLFEFSLLEAFEKSSFAGLLEGMKRSGDIFHTNSIEILDGRFSHLAPWMRRGNLLISILFLDTICVVDPNRKIVVWALRGNESPSFRGQHDPRLLPNGHILLFDNWGREGKSKVIEFDPFSMEVLWMYPSRPDSDFYTATCGTSQRLANGNTLITESEKGRAFEVTREGDIVWEFFNPFRGGEESQLIATLFEMRRVSEDYLDLSADLVND